MKSNSLLFTHGCFKEILLDIELDTLTIDFLKKEYAPISIADQFIFLSKEERKRLTSTTKDSISETAILPETNMNNWGEYGLSCDDFHEIMSHTKKFWVRNHIISHWSKVYDLLTLMEFQLIDNQNDGISGIKVLRNYLSQKLSNTN